MKKICLLAAAVSVFALNANATSWNTNDYYRPYIGADYVYSHLKQGSKVKHAKKDYSSWKVNLGVDLGKYTSLEAFFQQSGERKSHHEPEKIKSEYYAWGLNDKGQLGIGKTCELQTCLSKIETIPCEIQDVCPSVFMIDVNKCPGEEIELDCGYVVPVGKEDRYYIEWYFNGKKLNTFLLDNFNALNTLFNLKSLNNLNPLFK